MPESFSALFLVLAVFQYERGRAEQFRKGQLLLVGVWIGLATVCRQSNIIVGLVLLAALFLASFRAGGISKFIQRAALLTLGGVAVLLATLWATHHMFGDALFFLRKSSSMAEIWVRDEDYRPFWKDPLFYIRTLSSMYHFAGLGTLLFLCSLISCIRGPLRLEGVVVGVYSLYFTLGSVSLKHYVPPEQVDRYLVAVIPFLAMCGAYWLERAYSFVVANDAAQRRKAWRTITGNALVLIPLGISVIVALLNNRPICPVTLQTHLIERALSDQHFPVHATRDFLSRYNALLSEAALASIRHWTPGDPLPDPCAVFLCEDDFEKAAQRKVLERGIDWGHARWEGIEMQRSVLRRVLDRMRGRSLTEYGRGCMLYVVRSDKSFARHGTRSLPWGEALSHE
jgi:hypothetical protein